MIDRKQERALVALRGPLRRVGRSARRRRWVRHAADDDRLAAPLAAHARHPSAHALVGEQAGRRDVFLVDPESGVDTWYARRQLGKPLPPGPPAQTRVTTDPATGQLVIAWPYVWGATAYQVWRSGTRLATTRQTRFVDTTATPGSTYSYTVRAINKQGRSPLGPDATGGLR